MRKDSENYSRHKVIITDYVSLSMSCSIVLAISFIADNQNVLTHNISVMIKFYNQSYSVIHRPSNTLANISISLLEIPNRVANSRQFFTASITSETIFSAVFRLSI